MKRWRVSRAMFSARTGEVTFASSKSDLRGNCLIPGISTLERRVRLRADGMKSENTAEKSAESFALFQYSNVLFSWRQYLPQNWLAISFLCFSQLFSYHFEPGQQQPCSVTLLALPHLHPGLPCVQPLDCNVFACACRAINKVSRKAPGAKRSSGKPFH